MAQIIKAQPLTRDAFAKYGAFNQLLAPQGWPYIGDENVKFYREMALCDLGLAHTAAISNCVIRQRPLELHFVEKHNTTCEGVLILDADVLVHVGIALDGGAAPTPEQLEAFLVPKGTFLVMRPGVWHDAPYVLNAPMVNTMVILPEHTFENDCFGHEYIFEDGQYPIFEP